MSATAYTKPTYEILSGKTKYGNIRMQGDILLFAGHGNSNKVSFNSTGVYNTSNASKIVDGKKYVGLTKTNMSKVKLAIFAGCETAKNKDSNLPKTAVNNGAKTAIGWNKTVNWLSLKFWMKNFNENLAKGQTVYNAIMNANKKDYIDNNVKEITLYGNKNLTITLPATRAKVTSASYSSNKVTWDKVTGAKGYEVYRSTSKNGSYSLNKTITSGSTLSYTNTGLATGKTYYYKVRSYRLVDGKNVYSNFSEVVSATPKLSTPSLTLNAGTKKVNIKWSEISGASGYEVYRATSKEGTYSKVKTITSGSTVSYTDSKLTSKKTYYYKIRAYRTVSEKKVYSSYSSIKYIKTK